MKKIVTIICLLALMACGHKEPEAKAPKQDIRSFKMEVKEVKDGYATLKIQNTQKKEFAYAVYSPTLNTPIPYYEVRLIFTDTATIKVNTMMNIQLYQIEKKNGGSILRPDGWCNIDMYFQIH